LSSGSAFSPRSSRPAPRALFWRVLECCASSSLPSALSDVRHACDSLRCLPTDWPAFCAFHLALLPAVHGTSDFAGRAPRPCLCALARSLVSSLCPCLRARRLVSPCTRPREPLLSGEFTHSSTLASAARFYTPQPGHNRSIAIYSSACIAGTCTQQAATRNEATHTAVHGARL
jgi:hypothetical protein